MNIRIIKNYKQDFKMFVFIPTFAIGVEDLAYSKEYMIDIVWLFWDIEVYLIKLK